MSAIKESLVESVSLRCDCLCTMVVVDKFINEPDESAAYNISFQSSCMKWGFHSLSERLRAAWSALKGSPYPYADVWIEDEKEFAEFVQKLKSMVGARKIAALTGECRLCVDCPDGCPIDTPNDPKNVDET